MPDEGHPHSTVTVNPGRTIDYRSTAMELMADHSFISLSSLSKALGCSYWTVYGWWKNDPAFAAAFKASRQHSVDEVKQAAIARATGADGAKPSDLMSIYILNNFDEEIVERTSKQRAEITIRLEVPSLSAPADTWEAEVARALPDAAVEATYREVLSVPKESVE